MAELLNRAALMNRKKIEPQEFQLPCGGAVLMRVPSGPDWRAYQASLRTAEGMLIDKRFDRKDELLLATLLADPETKDRMFSIDDVMGGAFDEAFQHAADLNAMLLKAQRLYGIIETNLVTDEDREKNSSGTEPNE
jgi:hypothetical protein